MTDAERRSLFVPTVATDNKRYPHTYSYSTGSAISASITARDVQVGSIRESEKDDIDERLFTSILLSNAHENPTTK